MAGKDSVKSLQVALVVIGVFLVVGVLPLTILWPSGWVWHSTGHSPYLHAILGAYATLGVFLLLAARHPLENLRLIWFAATASFVQGVIMVIHVVRDPAQRGHWGGDIPAAFLAAIVLATLTARAEKASGLGIAASRQ